MSDVDAERALGQPESPAGASTQRMLHSRTRLSLLPCALVFFLVSQRSGHLAQRVGVRAMTAGGTAAIGCGLLVLAMTYAGQPLTLAATGLALTGIGMGLNTGPLIAVAVEAVTAARSGAASALINVARMAGATLGVRIPWCGVRTG